MVQGSGFKIQNSEFRIQTVVRMRIYYIMVRCK